MGRMLDLFVKKISFVRRPANKREFLLFKSADPSEKEKDKNKDKDKDKDKNKNKNKNKKTGGKNSMSLNAEVLKSARKILDESRKKEEEITADAVIEKLQKDLKEDLSEAERLAVESIVEFESLTIKNKKEADKKKRANETPEEKEKREKLEAAEKKEKEEKEAAEKKKREDAEKLKSDTEKKLEKADKKIEELEKRISDHEDVQKTSDATAWIKKNARFSVEDVAEMAKELVALEKTSETAAKALKSSLQRTSTALEDSDTFKSLGSTQDGKHGQAATELVETVNKAKTEKGEKISEVDAVNKAMNTSEAAADYAKYRGGFREESRRRVSNE